MCVDGLCRIILRRFVLQFGKENVYLFQINITLEL